jgi:subtilisin family serine protease
MSKSKIDPGLRYLAHCAQTGRRRQGGAWRHLAKATDSSLPRANVLVELERDQRDLPAGLAAAGFVVHARAGPVVSGDLPVSNIGLLADMPGVKRAEASRVLPHELDAALPEANIAPLHTGPLPRRGSGVVVGIVDSGIDFRHPSFQKADGSSRILAIWDQGLTPVQGEVSPAPFNYGVEYKQATISAALRPGARASLVRHVDPAPFHGTHVAGIAAGNGQPAKAPMSGGKARFVGVAPDADLIVVANTRTQAQNPGSLGDSADTLDAVQYILNSAVDLGRPVAINHSQGDNVGPHDGSSLLEVGIDHLIAGRGRVLIKSAGNEGDKSHHAEGDLNGAAPHLVEIKIFAGVEELVVDFWYRGGDGIGLRITPPRGTPSAQLRPPFNDDVVLSNGNTAFVDADQADPGNGDNRTFVVLHNGRKQAIQSGVWRFELAGRGAWHAWLQRDSGAAFRKPFLSERTTISIPGTARNVICVGSYVNKGMFVGAAQAGTLSNLSSRGPTRDGRFAPTLAAPGEEITSPQPAPVLFGPMKGTSMSAPLVTGAAALMLEINKRLTAGEIRTLLEQTARLDDQTGNVRSNDWGAGKLDVQAACVRAGR